MQSDSIIPGRTKSFMYREEPMAMEKGEKGKMKKKIDFHVKQLSDGSFVLGNYDTEISVAGKKELLSKLEKELGLEDSDDKSESEDKSEDKSEDDSKED